MVTGRLLIEGRHYDVAVCPLCGKVDKLVFTSRFRFDRLNERGINGISVNCGRCNLRVFEESHLGAVYEQQLNTLLKRWNKRF